MAYFDIDKRREGTLPHHGITASYAPVPQEKAAGEYIVSGIPFVSASTGAHDDGNTYEVTFPTVSQWFQVQNPSGGAMKIGFTAGGIADQQYFELPASTISDVYRIRTKSIFINSHGSGYSIIAGLTDVMTGSFADFESNSTHWGT